MPGALSLMRRPPAMPGANTYILLPLIFSVGEKTFACNIEEHPEIFPQGGQLLCTAAQATADIFEVHNANSPRSPQYGQDLIGSRRKSPQQDHAAYSLPIHGFPESKKPAIFENCGTRIIFRMSKDCLERSPPPPAPTSCFGVPPSPPAPARSPPRARALVSLSEAKS